MPSFIPAGKQQFFDSAGNPLVGGSVYTYIPGTTTAKTTYQDAAGTIANTNPITLDAAGECIILGTGQYRQQVYDINNNLLWDQVTGAPELNDLVDNTSSGSPLVVNSLSVTNLTVANETDTASITVPTQLSTDNSTKAASTAFVQSVFSTATVVLPLYGLVLSYVSTTSYGISAGAAVSDDAATYMSLSSAFTKTFASWSAGTGNGSLDTGTVATSTWYHVYLIENTTSKAIDILCSVSATGPTMPSGYTKKVRIGALFNNSSGNLLNFVQVGNKFLYTSPILDLNAVTVSSSAASATLTSPSGIKVDALLRGILATSVATGSVILTTIYSPDVTDSASTGNFNVSANGITSNSEYGGSELTIRTNTSSQVGYISNISTASATLSIRTLGFIDRRGLT